MSSQASQLILKRLGYHKTTSELPMVTLIALTGKNYKRKEHIEALEISSREIEFGEVKLVELEEIVDIDSWNKAVVYELWKYIDTEFLMFIHADGYIIHPELWDNKWLEYDYCGAPWPLPKDNYSYKDIYGNIQRVGNSVGLRSKKLMRLPTELKLVWGSYYGNSNEDGFLSVHNRHILEENSCKFMPFEESLVFGKECELPENKNIKTFCFHSL